jgi:hypothetical protein
MSKNGGREFDSSSAFESLDWLHTLSGMTGCLVVSKGHHTMFYSFMTNATWQVKKHYVSWMVEKIIIDER